MQTLMIPAVQSPPSASHLPKPIGGGGELWITRPNHTAATKAQVRQRKSLAFASTGDEYVEVGVKIKLNLSQSWQLWTKALMLKRCFDTWPLLCHSPVNQSLRFPFNEDRQSTEIRQDEHWKGWEVHRLDHLRNGKAKVYTTFAILLKYPREHQEQLLLHIKY